MMGRKEILVLRVTPGFVEKLALRDRQESRALLEVQENKAMLDPPE